MLKLAGSCTINGKQMEIGRGGWKMTRIYLVGLSQDMRNEKLLFPERFSGNFSRFFKLLRK